MFVEFAENKPVGVIDETAQSFHARPLASGHHRPVVGIGADLEGV